MRHSESSNLELASSKIDENEIVPIWNSRVPNLSENDIDDEHDSDEE